MVLLGLLMDGGHWGPRPSQKLASLQPLSSLHLSPLRRVQPDVQQGPCNSHREMNDTLSCVAEDASNPTSSQGKKQDKKDEGGGKKWKKSRRERKEGKRKLPTATVYTRVQLETRRHARSFFRSSENTDGAVCTMDECVSLLKKRTGSFVRELFEVYIGYCPRLSFGSLKASTFLFARLYGDCCTVRDTSCSVCISMYDPFCVTCKHASLVYLRFKGTRRWYFLLLRYLCGEWKFRAIVYGGRAAFRAGGNSRRGIFLRLGKRAR